MYAASNINGELSIRRKLQCKGPLLKKISKVILPLHVMTGCDVTSSFFGVDKLVWKRVQESAETQMFLTQLSYENLNKCVIKYIYNNKVSTTLTEVREQKWKNIINRKAQTCARIRPDADSNLHRNDRAI